MIENQHNPHDKFFKEIFTRKQEAQAFIKGFLPKEIVDNLILENLELDTNSYIDETLQDSFADIVYNCSFSKQKIKISFLFEHKTYQDKNIYLQILRYMLNIWEKERKNKQKKLTPILPIVIYHGRKKWRLKSFFDDFEKLPNNFSNFIPNFDYFLQDLHLASEQELTEKYESIVLQTSFLLMKNIFDKLALKQKIIPIFEKIYNSNIVLTDRNVISTLYFYLFYTNSEDEFVELTKQIKQIPNTEKDMISMAEILISKGIKKGEELGIKKGEELGIKKGEELGIKKGEELGIKKGEELGIKKGLHRTACVMLLEEFDVDTIMKITKLSRETIAELKQLVEKQGADVLNMF